MGNAYIIWMIIRINGACELAYNNLTVAMYGARARMHTDARTHARRAPHTRALRAGAAALL